MNGLRDKVRYSLLSNVIKICFTIIKLQREKFKEAFRFNLWYINLGQSRILKSWQHCCWQRSINLSKLRTTINIQGKKIYIYIYGRIRKAEEKRDKFSPNDPSTLFHSVDWERFPCNDRRNFDRQYFIESPFCRKIDRGGWKKMTRQNYFPFEYTSFTLLFELN